MINFALAVGNRHYNLPNYGYIFVHIIYFCLKFYILLSLLILLQRAMVTCKQASWRSFQSWVSCEVAKQGGREVKRRLRSHRNEQANRVRIYYMYCRLK